MMQRTSIVRSVILSVLFTLAPAPQAQASGFVTPGPPMQRLWIRDALTGVSIPQARAKAVSAVKSLTVQAWADPSGRLRLFPSARTETIEVFAAGYHSATIAPSPVAAQTTTVWLMPMRWPRALHPQVIAARKLPNTVLLHGHVIDGRTGRPVPGVIVALAGTDARTTTDEEGYFLLYATATRGIGPEAATRFADLVLSAPGYVSVRLAHIALSEGELHSIVDLERGSGETVAAPGPRWTLGR